MPNHQATDRLIEILDSKQLVIKDVLKSLESNADVNVINKDGIGLLHFLVLQNDKRKMHQYIEQFVDEFEANIDVRNSKGETPFQLVLNQIQSGRFNLRDAMEFLRFGADPDQKSKKGNAILHFIADFNHNSKDKHRFSEVIPLFRDTLAYGANINQKAAQGQTPLQIIIDNDATPQEILFMLKNGADPKTTYRGCPLAQLFLERQASLEEIKELAKYHVDIHVKTDNLTPMEAILASKHNKNVSEGSKPYRTTDIFGLLDIDPALIEVKNKNGQTAAHLLAYNNKKEALLKLAENYGADLTIKDKFGNTPIKIASEVVSGDPGYLHKLSAFATVNLNKKTQDIDDQVDKEFVNVNLNTPLVRRG